MDEEVKMNEAYLICLKLMRESFRKYENGEHDREQFTYECTELLSLLNCVDEAMRINTLGVIQMTKESIERQQRSA